ncbi:hypothetical protein LDO26_00635 [Luteimonas sp. BDR2-5]|uniref:hypothetical protein n=1 Tax=Proluteimonas luteida TaxID=2878685 RepID=UPI001E60AAF4|nr:hypothetical protein [Luteimonas sp. BDR2-5]MCD9026720.1 hypothetical protein [Luteimonas sp. BDR2-5]
MIGHFHHLFEIETDRFAGAAPRPDAINEMIGGDELAAWLHGRLCARGHACGEVYAEDHGWDFEITQDRRRYRVVCSCDFPEEGVPETCHFVQVAQTKGAPTAPDPLLAEVRAILAAEPDIAIVSDAAK